MSAPYRVRLRLKFAPGSVVATQGALAATTHQQRIGYLGRHLSGDWGQVCGEDAASNDAAIGNGDRILSAYPIDPAKPCKGFGENTVWIITEADRQFTRVLAPHEF